MKLVIRKSTPKQVRLMAPQVFAEAMKFIEKRYPEVSWESVTHQDLTILFGKGSRGRFYRDGKAEFNGPLVYICDRITLYYYDRKTVGITTPPSGLKTGVKISMISQLIHELTHYVQWMEGRNASEVETTQNEIDWLKDYDQYWYDKLIDC